MNAVGEFNLINPSFSKPFSTHTYPHLLPRGGGGGGVGGRAKPPQLSQNPLPHEHEILQGIRDTFESLRNVKVVYIVFTWLP